ncbi:MAG: hypothetical protein GY708_18660 [Actinomycetia bacterium]|nr:hypothetical protein [Actinomycetes bacterium]MCP4959558.1 hypothetical protein [Actinomycetes bacterium]
MGPVELAKQAIDVGFQTNRWEEHESFWRDQIGLPYNHLLKVGGGVHQHRHDLHGAVCKVNSVRDTLPVDQPGGYVGLTIVASHDEAIGSHATPDGTPVRVITHAAEPTVLTIVDIEVTDVEETKGALVALGAIATDDSTVRLGETQLSLVENTNRQPTGERNATGFRYLTIQVADVRAAHAHALGNGLTEGTAPIKLGEVAFISFVRLPDGDWIELSQRASLTGPLPDV